MSVLYFSYLRCKLEGVTISYLAVPCDSQIKGSSEWLYISDIHYLFSHLGPFQKTSLPSFILSPVISLLVLCPVACSSPNLGSLQLSCLIKPLVALWNLTICAKHNLQLGEAWDFLAGLQFHSPDLTNVALNISFRHFLKFASQCWNYWFHLHSKDHSHLSVWVSGRSFSFIFNISATKNFSFLPSVWLSCLLEENTRSNSQLPVPGQNWLVVFLSPSIAGSC